MTVSLSHDYLDLWSKTLPYPIQTTPLEQLFEYADFFCGIGIYALDHCDCMFSKWSLQLDDFARVSEFAADQHVEIEDRSRRLDVRRFFVPNFVAGKIVNVTADSYETPFEFRYNISRFEQSGVVEAEGFDGLRIANPCIAFATDDLLTQFQEGSLSYGDLLSRFSPQTPLVVLSASKVAFLQGYSPSHHQLWRLLSESDSDPFLSEESIVESEAVDGIALVKSLTVARIRTFKPLWFVAQLFCESTTNMSAMSSHTNDDAQCERAAHFACSRRIGERRLAAILDGDEDASQRNQWTVCTIALASILPLLVVEEITFLIPEIVPSLSEDVALLTDERCSIVETKSANDASRNMSAITCRICLGNEDDDLGRLISPCLCSGTMRFVHLECLNQWRFRTTNPSSFFQCEQCKYRYSFRRTLLSSILRSALVLHVLTIVTFVLVVFVSSVCASIIDWMFFEGVGALDLFRGIFEYENVDGEEDEDEDEIVLRALTNGLGEFMQLSRAGVRVAHLACGLGFVGTGGFLMLSTGFLPFFVNVDRRGGGGILFVVVVGTVQVLIGFYSIFKRVSAQLLASVETRIVEVGETFEELRRELKITETGPSQEDKATPSPEASHGGVANVGAKIPPSDSNAGATDNKGKAPSKAAALATEDYAEAESERT
eukprot:g2176.t1